MSSENKYAIYRHLGVKIRGPTVPGHATVSEMAAGLLADKRPDMTWKDHLVMLLHIGAEIEHSLMVQYLYAAYSLGGDQIPAKRRDMVLRWREEILAVAKEEMGHLLTVQNVLTLIGAPINLGRLDLPWDIPFYPFPFQLEPLSLDSVACYVYAEMPSEQEFANALGRRPGKLLERYRKFETRDRARIVKRVRHRTTKEGAHRVGELYDQIVTLLGDSARIPDHEFHEETFTFQASGDEWGRGYQPRPRTLDAEGGLIGADESSPEARRATRAPHVMVDRVATRSQAIAALKALGQQGEAPVLATEETDELSHFDRFLDIYQEFEALGPSWKPVRPVPTNPATLRDPAAAAGDGYISARHSQEWANLFNLRYRMLLKYLAHTFRLARAGSGDAPSVRAMVMHRVFAEMYNLKTIAGILVRLPRRDSDDPARAAAGPPFEMPYTLDLPGGELELWILHRDLIRSSQRLAYRLLGTADDTGRAYLATLIDLDGQTDTWIGQILIGLRNERVTA
jgi:hypothetical protein